MHISSSNNLPGFGRRDWSMVRYESLACDCLIPVFRTCCQHIQWHCTRTLCALGNRIPLFCSKSSMVIEFWIRAHTYVLTFIVISSQIINRLFPQISQLFKRFLIIPRRRCQEVTLHGLKVSKKPFADLSVLLINKLY